jgi:hypothetical protein
MVYIDLKDKDYDKLIKFLHDNNGTKIISILQKGIDGDYVPPLKEKLDKYDYTEGSASEEELDVVVDEDGFCSLR